MYCADFLYTVKVLKCMIPLDMDRIAENNHLPVFGRPVEAKKGSGSIIMWKIRANCVHILMYRWGTAESYWALNCSIRWQAYPGWWYHQINESYGEEENRGKRFIHIPNNCKAMNFHTLKVLETDLVAVRTLQSLICICCLLLRYTRCMRTMKYYNTPHMRMWCFMYSLQLRIWRGFSQGRICLPMLGDWSLLLVWFVIC